MKQRRCSGTTKAGARCRSFALPDSAWCVTHHPDRVTDLAAWRARGGRGRSSQSRAKKALPTALLSTDELLAYCTVAFKAVLAGTMDPKVGNSVITIAKGMTEIKAAGELDRLRDEVEDLKAAVAYRGSA